MGDTRNRNHFLVSSDRCGNVLKVVVNEANIVEYVLQLVLSNAFLGLQRVPYLQRRLRVIGIDQLLSFLNPIIDFLTNSLSFLGLLIVASVAFVFLLRQ